MSHEVDLNPLVQETAKHLDGFECQVNEHNQPFLVHADGRRLFLRTGWKLTGRVEVSGLYPNSATWRPGHSITVAINRGGEVVAKEITRRLLPEYTTSFTEVLAYIANAEMAEEKRRSVMAHITAAIGEDVLTEDKRIFFHGGDVWVQDGQCRWNFTTKDLTFTLAVARLIGQYGGK